MSRTPAAVCLSALIFASAPAAAEVKVVRTLDGLECRTVRASASTAACYAGVRDGGDSAACNLPAVRVEPRDGSDVLGRVASRVLVARGQRAGGFTGVVLPDGRPGWIEDAWLAPTPRGEVCEAVVLSNGRFGFRVR